MGGRDPGGSVHLGRVDPATLSRCYERGVLVGGGLIANTVDYNGTARPFDGIDAWPVLMAEMAELGREWLPATNQSMILNSTWKLIMAAPSTHYFTPTGGHIEDGWGCRAQGPLGNRNVSTLGSWACEVCSNAEPCLFHIVDDPEERTDVAKANPAIVEAMQVAMKIYNYVPYTTPQLPAGEAANYDCNFAQGGGGARTEFWGGMAGPCCHPKGPGPWPPPGPPPKPPPGPPPKPPPGPSSAGKFHSNLDTLISRFGHDPATGAVELSIGGWAWNGSFPGGGVPPMLIRIAVDHAAIATVVANITGPGIPGTGAPNAEHRFVYTITGAPAAALAGPGNHSVEAAAYSNPAPYIHGSYTQLSHSPWNWKDGKPAPGPDSEEHIN